MSATRILLVDDDAGLCVLVREVFQQRGLHLDFAHNGRAGLAMALEGNFDLVILDVMLPELDGFRVLDQIRRRSSVPVIILTARAEERDRITGLDRGADDYLPKPFGPDELLARIRAVLRRSFNRAPDSVGHPFTCGELEVNPQTREVHSCGLVVSLTSIEFEILLYLIKSTGRIVSRDEITTVLYQRPATCYERALDVHISHLRKKLDPKSSVIHTIRGTGYVLTPGGAEFQ